MLALKVSMRFSYLVLTVFTILGSYMYSKVSYTMVRGRMKGAAWGHIWHIDRAAATAGSILLSQGCIFGNQS